MICRILLTLLLILPATHCAGEEKPRSGHSIKAPHSDQQISLEITLIAVPEQDFVAPSLQTNFRSAPRPKPLSPPDVSAKDLAAAGGIQLVSATTITEKRQPVFAEIISEERKRKMIHEFQEAPSSNVMFGPKVTVFDQQTATVQDTVSRPFVVGIENDKSATRDSPEADILAVEEGTKFAFRSTIRGDSTVQLDLGMSLSNLRGVDVVSDGRKTSLQVPTLQQSRLSLSANVKSGETLAVWGFETTRHAEVETPAFGGIPVISRAFIK